MCIAKLLRQRPKGVDTSSIGDIAGVPANDVHHHRLTSPQLFSSPHRRYRRVKAPHAYGTIKTVGIGCSVAEGHRAVVHFHIESTHTRQTLVAGAAHDKLDSCAQLDFFHPLAKLSW